MTNLFRSQDADGIVGLSPSSSSFLHAIMLAHQAEHYHVGCAIHMPPPPPPPPIVSKADNSSIQDIFSLCFDVHGGSFVLGGYNTTIHDPNREITWVPYSGGSSRWASESCCLLALLVSHLLLSLSLAQRYNIRIDNVRVGSAATGGYSAEIMGALFGRAVMRTCGLLPRLIPRPPPPVPSVDSGTTFTYLPDAYFQHIKSQFNDLCRDDTSLSCGLASDMPACFDSTDYFGLAAKLPVITFSTSHGTIDLEPIDYLYSQNSQFCVALLADDGAGPVLGMTFLMG